MSVRSHVCHLRLKRWVQQFFGEGGTRFEYSVRFGFSLRELRLFTRSSLTFSDMTVSSSAGGRNSRRITKREWIAKAAAARWLAVWGVVLAWFFVPGTVCVAAPLELAGGTLNSQTRAGQVAGWIGPGLSMRLAWSQAVVSLGLPVPSRQWSLRMSESSAQLAEGHRRVLQAITIESGDPLNLTAECLPPGVAIEGVTNDFGSTSSGGIVGYRGSTVNRLGIVQHRQMTRYFESQAGGLPALPAEEFQPDVLGVWAELSHARSLQSLATPVLDVPVRGRVQEQVPPGFPAGGDASRDELGRTVQGRVPGSVQVELRALPQLVASPQMVFGTMAELESDAGYWLGVSCVESSPALLHQLDVQSGLTVMEVVPGGPSDGRLQKFDVLCELDNRPLQTTADLVDAVQSARDRDVRVRVIRKSQPIWVSLAAAARPQPATGTLVLQVGNEMQIGLPEMEELMQKYERQNVSLSTVYLIRPGVEIGDFAQFSDETAVAELNVADLPEMQVPEINFSEVDYQVHSSLGNSRWTWRGGPDRGGYALGLDSVNLANEPNLAEADLLPSASIDLSLSDRMMWLAPGRLVLSFEDPSAQMDGASLAGQLRHFHEDLQHEVRLLAASLEQTQGESQRLETELNESRSSQESAALQSSQFRAAILNARVAELQSKLDLLQRQEKQVAEFLAEIAAKAR